jgi:lipoate-protein ligase A
MPHCGAIKLTVVETRSVSPGNSASLESVVPGQWELWHSGPATGLRNMAIDAALLRRVSGYPAEAEAGPGDAGPARRAGVWRCYGWSRPTVSFGRNERTRGRFDAASVAAAGLDAVRRPTGGRALLHARDVTYSAAFPLAAGTSWRVAYDAVNAILRDALAALGVDAAIVPHGGGTRPDSGGPLCFDRPDAGEIVVGGAKLAGSAVWRERGGYLQHGSILLHDDQSLLVAAACGPVPAPPDAASLAAIVRHAPSPGRPMDDDELRRAVESAIAARLAANATVTGFTSSASIDADVAHFETRFAARDWLWRR